MSRLSEVYRCYRQALRESQQLYEQLYTSRMQAAREFYRDWLHQLIIKYRERWENRVHIDRLRRTAERFFGRTEIDFCAIDGSCYKNVFTDFMVFFGASYGVKGRLSLSGSPPRLRYERWSMDQDVSMVAYVPVPVAQIDDVLPTEPEEQFLVTEEDKVNLASIHVKIMQLAEVYMAYHVVNASDLSFPRLILLDHSLSSIFSGVERGSENVGLTGYRIGQRLLDRRDVEVALSRPYNRQLGVPAVKHFHLHRRLLAELTWAQGKSINLAELARRENIPFPQVKAAAARLAGLPPAGIQPPVAAIDAEHQLYLYPGFNPVLSWYDVVRLFENICRRLFIDKDQSALVYTVCDKDGNERRRWMSPDDIDFLTAVGLRALVERCWEKKIMLVGIAKDSASRFFSRHYLGVMRHCGFYPRVEVGLLPWTDRVMLEAIAQYEEDITCPWSTVEFDSCFMTLHLKEDQSHGNKRLAGMRGRIVLPPERLFLRSLGQFYLLRRPHSCRMGHVIFIDRLTHPFFDLNATAPAESGKIKDKELGSVKPLIYLDNNSENPGQDLMMFFLDVLTRNLFPEVIGYPDPLHKADWGAKTVLHRAIELIHSSEQAFRIQPQQRLVRSLRDEVTR